MADELSAEIGANAAGPKEVVQDGTSVTQHNLPDQIAADRYLAEKRKAGLGISFRKIVPPGGP